jgi:AcrR family transcriptional regulator
MARGRSAGYDDQRAAILAEAARLFARNGFVATSMNQVAEACSLSKAALYHYFRDKYALLIEIAEGHVQRLLEVIEEVEAEHPNCATRLPALIQRFVYEYSSAQDAHRVLTEDVRFLEPSDRERILDVEREVVARFASCIAMVRPDLNQRLLAKPLAMLLFGMINWLFTWFKPDAQLDYPTLAPLVTELFLHGLTGLRVPAQVSEHGEIHHAL